MNSKKFVRELFLAVRYRGFFPTLKNRLKLLFEELKFVETVRKRRRKIANRLDKLFDSTVAYGPFRGLKLTKNQWWGFSDRSAMFFGLYEQEVLTSLQNIPPEYRTFVDLGAADGYYGIGVLINKMFDRSYCFEISEEGQYVIKENAALNGVSDRVVIKGIAEKDFYRHLSAGELERAVVFIDIEGAEFALLDKTTLHALKDAIIIIELHDWFFEDGDAKLRNLKDAAKATHSIVTLAAEGRDPSKFEELKRFHDTDRWLLCSEGRKRLMTWVRLDPLRS
ncbi:MAG: hypothetical protein WC521_08045 [Bdellovibrionales bacterium]|jgi:hypothetical protein